MSLWSEDVPLPATPAENPDQGATPSSLREWVLSVVARIPRGRVTTYGSIARALGMPRGARAVGWALRGAPDASRYPCHRVVNHAGYLSGGWHWGHPDVMAALLRDEGVPFVAVHQVDLEACLWLPDDAELPTPIFVPEQ